MTQLKDCNIYFFSDAHLALEADEHEIERQNKLLAFLDFLAAEGRASELFILGDLFDFWFEWYHVIPKYWFPVLFRLKKLVDSGTIVHFVVGNHDFYTGKFLENEIGIHCHTGSFEFERNGKRFFAGHGDGLANEDKGYRFLKKIIRHPASIFLFKTLISADLGMKIAQWTSHSSRKWIKIEKHSWSEEYYRFARVKFDTGIDYVILGHIHFPMIRHDENDGKTYVNCGDWITQFSFAHYDGNRLILKYWEDKKEESK